MDVYEAAEGINTILASNMANAIRSRTVQKGHDPRKFTLAAFGGAGPMMAVEVARYLKIPEVIVPAYPGITSALGLLTTDLKYDFLRTEFMVSTAVRLDKLHADIEELETTAREGLRRDGIPDDRIQLRRSLDLRYLGQGYELRIPLPSGVVDKEVLARVWSDFHARHEAEYGHSFPHNPVEIVNLRIAAIGLMPALSQPQMDGRSRGLREARLGGGQTYFRVDGTLQRLRTEFYERSRLPLGSAIEGPAVIFQQDSTSVLPPESRAQIDEFGNIVIAT